MGVYSDWTPLAGRTALFPRISTRRSVAVQEFPRELTEPGAPALPSLNRGEQGRFHGERLRTDPHRRRGAARAGAYPIDLAIADYDRTRPIIDGRVKPEGIALNTETGWIGDFCIRPVYQQYDAAEMSLSWYVAARCRGEPVVALPIFPLRMPVLAYVLVRKDAPYAEPKKFWAGKRIGVPLYRLTVGCGCAASSATITGSRRRTCTGSRASPKELRGFVIPPGITVTPAQGRTPEALLERGAVDAILVPQGFVRRSWRHIRNAPPLRDPKAEMPASCAAAASFPSPIRWS